MDLPDKRSATVLPGIGEMSSLHVSGTMSSMLSMQASNGRSLSINFFVISISLVDVQWHFVSE